MSERVENVRAEMSFGKDIYIAVYVNEQGIFDAHIKSDHLDLAVSTLVHVLRYVTGVGCKHER